MGNILQRFSSNRGSMTLSSPPPSASPEVPKNISDESCEKSPAPLPVEEGNYWFIELKILI